MEGDEEKAYLFFMRYLNVAQTVKKHPRYMHNKDMFDQQITKKSMQEALEQAEKLAENLSERCVCVHVCLYQCLCLLGVCGVERKPHVYSVWLTSPVPCVVSMLSFLPLGTRKVTVPQKSQLKVNPRKLKSVATVSQRSLLQS